jgi:4-amino-4-deoxy-L-arabinose transferase-like glycosyltransferase
MPLEQRSQPRLNHIHVLVLGTILLVSGLVSVVLLYAVNFDEAYNLQIPLNLIRYGVYGSRTSQGFEWFDARVSTGPMVLVPVALSFAMLGTGIVQGRIVPVLYACVLALSVHRLSKRTYGSWAAATSVLLLSGIKNVYHILGITVGEGAGVALCLLGCLAWSEAERRHARVFALLAGMLWGIAVWAKPSMLVAIPFVLAGGIAAYLRSRQNRTARLFACAAALAAAIGAAWFLLLAALPAEADATAARSEDLLTLVRQQLDPALARNLAANAPELAAGLGLPTLLGSLLGFHQARHARRLLWTRSVMTAVPMLWIAWWLLCNNSANHRHLFPGVLLGVAPLSGALLENSGGRAMRLARVAMAALVVVSLVLPGSVIAHFAQLAEANAGKLAQARFADHVSQLEPDAELVGLGWFMAWDIAFLTERAFGSLDSSDWPLDEPTYAILTPTILHFPESYASALQTLASYSSTVKYEEDGYSLYRLNCPLD